MKTLFCQTDGCINNGIPYTWDDEALQAEADASQSTDEPFTFGGFFCGPCGVELTERHPDADKVDAALDDPEQEERLADAKVTLDTPGAHGPVPAVEILDQVPTDGNPKHAHPDHPEHPDTPPPDGP